MANRLLILQYLSSTPFEIENLSLANDTLILRKALENKLCPPVIHCEDAGTVFRFLTCVCATESGGGVFKLKGTKRLLERPMAPLINCLQSLGASILLVKKDGAPDHLAIQGATLERKPISIPGDVSSQFISGLCLIAPRIKNGLDLSIEGPVLSKPYINLTLALMAKLGVRSTFKKNHIRILPQTIIGQKLRVESDWSSACFFYASLLLSNDLKSIFIEDLYETDLQGDRYITEIGTLFGIQTTFKNKGALLEKKNEAMLPQEISLEDYPDLAVPFIVACAFKYPNVRLKNLQHLELKESNRIEALRFNLEKFGISLRATNGTISFHGAPHRERSAPLKISTFGDHRIAMSFALLAALGYTIELDNIKCIDKSFPHFFVEMAKVGLRLKN